MFREIGAIWSHEALSKDVLLIEASLPNIAVHAIPGQFLHVRVYSQSLDPLLRRPISIYKVDKKLGRIFLLYQIRGKGTNILSTLREGDALDVMGPLGKGFQLSEADGPYLLVGGGMGTAPMTFAAQYLSEHSIPYKIVIAGRTQKELYAAKTCEEFGSLPVLATEDGSIGLQGNAVDAVLKVLERESFGSILACGPHGMLCALKERLTGMNIPLYLSLEARMACGVGACLGCTVKKAESDGYYKVCKDGPVFSAWEVDLRV